VTTRLMFESHNANGQAATMVSPRYVSKILVCTMATTSLRAVYIKLDLQSQAYSALKIELSSP
jgi:hypothetical protein